MSNRVRVQRHPKGMLFVSIPRALAQALGTGKGGTLERLLLDGEHELRRLK